MTGLTGPDVGMRSKGATYWVWRIPVHHLVLNRGTESARPEKWIGSGGFQSAIKTNRGLESARPRYFVTISNYYFFFF